LCAFVGFATVQVREARVSARFWICCMCLVWFMFLKLGCYYCLCEQYRGLCFWMLCRVVFCLACANSGENPIFSPKRVGLA